MIGVHVAVWSSGHMIGVHVAVGALGTTGCSDGGIGDARSDSGCEWSGSHWQQESWSNVICKLQNRYTLL